MVDTVGEHRSDYQTVDQKAAQAPRMDSTVGQQKTSLRWKVAHAFGFAGLAATLGILGGAAADGHGPSDIASGTLDKTVDVAKGAAEPVKWTIKDIKTGSPNDPPDPFASKK